MKAWKKLRAFAEEVTDALTSHLAQIAALRVISRTSAMRYNGRTVPLSEISRELHVDAVVEGTAARVGERVRISVHLIDAHRDHQLWAENYERDLRDILALQAEIARAIANQIKIQMTRGEQTRFALVSQVNPGAYEAYARGRYFWNKRTADGFHKAIAYFDEAIERFAKAVWPVSAFESDRNVCTVFTNAAMSCCWFCARPNTAAEFGSVLFVRSAAAYELEMNETERAF